MAISIINQNDNVYDSPGTTFSLTHTVGAGTNRLLLVLVGYENEDFETITSVVWDAAGVNESLTEISTYSTTDDAFVAAYYLIAPSVTAAKLITVTLSSSLDIAGASIVAFTLDGVDQSTPIRDEDGDAQQSVNTLSATVTVVSGDFLAVHANQENTGQTMDYDSSTFTVTLTQDNVDAGTDPTFHSGYGTADAASETGQMDSTITEHSALQLVAIAPAAVSSSSSSSSSSVSSSSSSSSSSVSSSSASPGTVVWGHDTGTIEDFIRDFGGNWTTTQWSISGAGDDEVIYAEGLTCGQTTLSEDWYLGAFESTITYDQYQTGSGPIPLIHYITATTKAGLLIGSWTLYNGVSFTSLGWVKIRITHS